MNGVDSRTQSTAAYQSNSTRKTSVTPGTHRGASHIPPAGRPGMAGTTVAKPGDTGQGTAGQGAFEGQNGTAGTSRIVGVAGMRSGTAGTGRFGTGAPADHGGSSGTAGATRFTAVSSQRINEGGADSRVTAAEQNHISMAQGGQPRGAAAERRQPPPPPGQGASAKQSPGATRFTSRPADTAHIAERGAAAAQGASKAGGSTQVSIPASPGKGASADMQTMGGASHTGTAGTGSGQSRHSRNAPRSGGSTSGSAPATARQERPTISTHPASRAAGPAARPGTAGTGARGDKAAQTRQTAQKQASASKSTPTATGMSGGRRPSSGAPAQQERQRPDDRKSRRKPGNGGIKDGK